MPEKAKVYVRKTTVGDFVAELIEASAKAMPPSMKDQAKILRDSAKEYRKLNRKFLTVHTRYVPSNINL
jgi:hypothetical protein